MGMGMLLLLVLSVAVADVGWPWPGLGEGQREGPGSKLQCLRGFAARSGRAWSTSTTTTICMGMGRCMQSAECAHPDGTRQTGNVCRRTRAGAAPRRSRPANTTYIRARVRCTTCTRARALFVHSSVGVVSSGCQCPCSLNTSDASAYPQVTIIRGSASGRRARARPRPLPCIPREYDHGGKVEFTKHHVLGTLVSQTNFVGVGLRCTECGLGRLLWCSLHAL